MTSVRLYGASIGPVRRLRIMPIDPNRPPMSDRVQSLQRETYSDLPDANKTTAFTLAWVELDEPGHPKGMYVNRVTTPQGDRQWEMVGGGAVGSSLPDTRFVVGKKLLNLESPGSSTYVTISDAVAAASAYQAISGGLPAVILVHPDKYDESVTLPPGVSMSGLSSGSNKVVIGGSVTVKGGTEIYGSVSALKCERLEVELTGKNQRCDLFGIEVMKGISIQQAPGSGMVNVLLIDCNSILELKASASEAFVGVYGGAIGGFIADAGGGFLYSRLMGTYLSPSNGFRSVQMNGGIGYFIDCVHSGPDDVSPIGVLTGSATAYFVGGVREADSFPYVVTSPDGTGRLYWNNVSGPTGKVSIDTRFDPSLSLRSPLVTGNGYSSFTVGLLINGGGPSLATIPHACETFEADVTYTVPPDSVRANNAYAIVSLPSVKEILLGKRVKVINGRSLSHPQSGPIAVVPFPGESIGDLTGTDPNITSMDYLILAGGDFVDLSSTSTGWKICG
jgi:hypothetical protein